MTAPFRRSVPRNPIRPFEAMKAMRTLLRDKEDTAQVFKIIRALSGNSFEDRFRDFCADPVGRRILAEKRSLLATLSDREGLRSCPPGSLGEAYLRFVTTENITADGLVAASKEGGAEEEDPKADPDRMLFGQRLRDMHDLWHVTTGYGRDGLGELCLLAFTYAQERNRGIGFIVLMALLKSAREHKDVPVITCVREGYRIGNRAARWLPAADWETLLHRPLEDVRRELGVVPPTAYLKNLAKVQEYERVSLAALRAGANTNAEPGGAVAA